MGARGSHGVKPQVRGVSMLRGKGEDIIVGGLFSHSDFDAVRFRVVFAEG